ncbi:MAG: ISL3 family transposase [Chloroflexota bacterium]|nr:ISL3 family transposase [Chloroflexota bacterium]
MHTSHSLLELITFLLPNAPDLRADVLEIDIVAPAITVMATSTQSSALCPECQQPATRVHSRYTRILTDLPWADVPVRLQLHVRRFFCPSPTCCRTIFTERLPTLVAPWARRTQRLAARHRTLGLALGGIAAARVAVHFDQPTSRDTMLRLVRQTPEQDAPVPRVLGVDDWAKRKGHNYGTILVDLDAHRPIEVLSDRTADTLADWLRTHPGVEVISRDRAGAYADGASHGAPHAVQVADRWHLLKNLGEALVRVLEAHRQVLTALVPAPPTASVEQVPGVETDDGPPSPQGASAVVADRAAAAPLTRAERERQQRRARRQDRHAQVQALHQDGLSQRAIGKHLHLDRRTVRKYLRAPTCPEPQPRAKRSSLLDPYKAYLLERWNAGCHTGTELLREIRAQGYAGGRSIAMDFIAAVRKQQGVPRMKRTGLAGQAATDPTERPPTPRALAWLILQRSERLEEADQARLTLLRQADPQIETAIRLAREFATIVRERQHESLDSWLRRTVESGITALRGFVTGIHRDYAAVKAAVSLPYSNGITEGHINRLKYLKRQMYGRAKFDLLRKRVLYAA